MSSSQGVSASGPPQPAQAGYPADASAIISFDNKSKPVCISIGTHTSDSSGASNPITPPPWPIFVTTIVSKLFQRKYALKETKLQNTN